MHKNNHANDHFACHYGSQVLYAHGLNKALYSEGVKDLATTCQSFWLIDLIFSHQIIPDVQKEEFQVWELFRGRDTEFDIIATDGNDHIISGQQVPYSDFPYDSAKFYFVNGVLMLPSEY